MVIDNNNGISKFFSKVYLWMFIGLLISGGVAYYTSITPSMIKFVYGSYGWILITELIVVIAFSALRKKVSPGIAKVLFVTYAAVSGLTLSSIFLVYKIQSIGMVFLSSSLMFGLLAVYGYITKTDLSSFGKILLFALLAIIIMSVINIFAHNGTFGIIISIISIVVFLGLTAWDMQALKAMYNYYASDEKELGKIAIYGALDLYLDFINIFLNLLSLFGKRND
ncbi:MAG: Bax inhibitor-1/YccA family protein [Candidatus Aphodocola sp.]